MQRTLCRQTVIGSPLRVVSRPLIRRKTVHVEAIGDKIQDWVKSPILLATFGPRVTLGALLTAPERLSQLPSDLSKVQQVLTSQSSTEEKANILLEEVELRLVDCLERGATIETDLYQNVRALLPENVQKNLPETSPFVPTSANTVSPDVSQEDDVTYTSASVAEEKATSETAGLQDAVVAVRTAQSTLKTNTSAAREKMLKMNLKEEREFLNNILSEIDVTTPGLTTLIQEAKDLITETEDLIK